MRPLMLTGGQRGSGTPITLIRGGRVVGRPLCGGPVGTSIGGFIVPTVGMFGH